MRARGKDGIEPDGWFARQQTVRHRQFLPSRLEDLRLTRSGVSFFYARAHTLARKRVVTSRLSAARFPVRVVTVQCARGHFTGGG